MEDNTVDTRARLHAAVELGCAAALGRSTIHMTQEFTGCDRANAIVICWVSCPDNIAGRLHAAIDRAVKGTLAESGWESPQYSAVRR